MLPLTPWTHCQTKQCTRWESNPRDIVGMDGGCHYLTGASFSRASRNRTWLREIWSFADVTRSSSLYLVGSEGVEPSPFGLKDRYAAITPRPRFECRAAFASKQNEHASCSLRPAGRTGVEPV